MDKFKALEPVRLYSSNNPSQKAQKPQYRLIGRLPEDLHLLILQSLPVPDIPAYARVSRPLSRLAASDSVWEGRWKALAVKEHSFEPILDQLEQTARKSSTAAQASQPPIVKVDDDFGDFASGPTSTGAGVTSGNGQDLFSSEEMGDFVGGTFASPAIPSLSTRFPLTATNAIPSAPSSRSNYTRAHSLLKPLTTALSSPPHLILTVLFPAPAPSLHYQSKVLHLLACFLSPRIQPLRNTETLFSALRAAADRFEATLLAAFDDADGRGDEVAMREAAEASWEVWDPRAAAAGSGSGEWELGRVWAEKREIFYMGGTHKPLNNFTPSGGLNFDAMDAFMNYVLDALREHGSRAVRVFPPASGVLLSFADRIASEVVGEYITPLLTHARSLANGALFLQATAASFREAWRIVDTVVQISLEDKTTDSEGKDTKSGVQVTQAEDVVYRMFELNMDEYLDEEVESVKQTFAITIRQWDKQLSSSTSLAVNGGSGSSGNTPTQPSFIASSSPANLKRSVLSSFTNVLLLPVTIVPRAVVAAGGAVGGAMGAMGGTVGGAAVQGISMLDPRRWGGQASGTFGGSPAGGYKRGAAGDGDGDDGLLFDEPEDEDEKDEKDEKNWRGSVDEKSKSTDMAWSEKENGDWDNADRVSLAPTVDSTANTAATDHTRTTSVTSARASTASLSSSHAARKRARTYDNLQLLLSLDVTLEIIHATRDSLKRVETFVGYPGTYGHRVHDTIEEVAVEMLRVIAQHIKGGFESAIVQMRTFQPPPAVPGSGSLPASGPLPGGDETSNAVAPLVQFFELVHIGDTIQSIVQVYFDKELTPHVDVGDFLNGVMREKKRFENVLDDSVAQGLNAGIEVLMNQVEHIILTLTPPRTYYPPEDDPLLLGPTKGCTEAIRCLEEHLRLLKGNVNREVLEVFETEVGVRLIGILQKHLKRQIISLNGGFQVIADLNAYHTFISSLKIPTLTSDFANLKMLGHVYIVEDAKDLAQIVRDVTRYGGSYRPEDIYEFIQRRSDWKKIEKIVDKTMYNLNLKEDCVVC